MLCLHFLPAKHFRVLPQNLGATQNSDNLEGGYRRAELERQKAILKERKEELETRRKRIISMKKRAARKAGGAANSNANDVLQEFGLAGTYVFIYTLLSFRVLYGVLTCSFLLIRSTVTIGLSKLLAFCLFFVYLFVC